MRFKIRFSKRELDRLEAIAKEKEISIEKLINEFINNYNDYIFGSDYYEN